jgi:hypothetical protein
MPPEQPNVPSPGRAVYTAVCTVQCSAAQCSALQCSTDDTAVIGCSGRPGGHWLLWSRTDRCRSSHSSSGRRGFMSCVVCQPDSGQISDRLGPWNDVEPLNHWAQSSVRQQLIRPSVSEIRGPRLWRRRTTTVWARAAGREGAAGRKRCLQAGGGHLQAGASGGGHLPAGGGHLNLLLEDRGLFIMDNSFMLFCDMLPYKSAVRLSVRGKKISRRLSVRPSVRPSVRFQIITTHLEKCCC